MNCVLGRFGDIDGCDRLAILISQALSGWLTLQRCCSRRESIYEHSLYLPLIEVAKSQGWQVSHEKEMVKSSHLKGRKVDFVLESRRNVAMVEVKYIGDIRSASSTYFSGKNYIPKDIENATFFYEERRRLNQYAYIIICGYKAVLARAFPENPRNKIRKHVYKCARDILDYDKDNVYFEYGWRCDEIGEDTNKMTTLVLRNKGTWHRL